MVKMTVGVDGMMCAMCEAHVSRAVKDKFEVKSATADKGKKTCTVVSEQPIPEKELRAAIDATGYKTLSYKCEPFEKKGFLSRFFG
ncbi:MAG: heavy metal-associated domain-containing protein [Sutterellaceae bacterium]|nr:heavy metal-associated domain-containing protein [Sutterellaceae bacterium]MDY2867628.1 heavy metal-associated domain-containing protein [Mesosutterella sp.]